MRTTRCSSLTKILPSPTLPVLAVFTIASMTGSTRSLRTAISTRALGTKSTTYSAPRYSSVCPRWRPNPLTSVTVMPDTPSSESAARTSSSLKGLMMAVISFMPGSPLSRAILSARPFHLRLGVVLQADALHQVELRLEPVDVLFFGFEDALENLARHEVAEPLAIGDRGLQLDVRRTLELQVTFEHLRHRLADHELAQVLQVRQSFEKQDALDQPVGMLHLVDRFL